MTNTAIDHGADGEAMKARPYEMLGDERNPVKVKRYSDVLVLDAYATKGLLGNDKDRDRRITAGEWFANTHRKAFPPKSTTAAYGQVRGEPTERQIYDPDNGKEYDALFWNRRVLRDLDMEIGKPVVGRLRDAIVYGYPMKADQLCRDLDALAKHRGIG